MTKDRNRNRTLHVLVGKRNAIPHGKCAPHQFTVIKEGLRPVRETLVVFFLCVAQIYPGVPRRQQLDRSDLETKKTDERTVSALVTIQGQRGKGKG